MRHISFSLLMPVALAACSSSAMRSSSAAVAGTASEVGDDASLDGGIAIEHCDEGYALWDSVIRPVVAAAVSEAEVAPSQIRPAGHRVLIDLGTGEAEQGEPTPSPDYLGQHWNNWQLQSSSDELLPGERLGELVDDAGQASSIELMATGGFQASGFQSGGLRWPSQERLGELAVGRATGDFFYATDDDKTGGFFIRGLDPKRRYRLRVFAGRDHEEERLTRYTASGANEVSATLQTSGPGAGQDTPNGNDDEVVTLAGLAPTPWGQLFVDVELVEGASSYISLVEIVAE